MPQLKKYAEDSDKSGYYILANTGRFQECPPEESSTVSLNERTGLDSDGSRIHVLEGTVASNHSMEKGYVELLIKYFREEDCLLLNLGRNFGGYIWFSGGQIDRFMTELSALTEWKRMSFVGRGYVETSLRTDYRRLETILNDESADTEIISKTVLPDLAIEAETVADVEIPVETKKPRPSYADEAESSYRSSHFEDR
jgi:hypothetical protein